MIELRQLTKRYGKVTALDQVSLYVGKGETLLILGPSGCGKTTLLRLVAGFERPDSGEVILDGLTASKPRGIMPPDKRDLGMIFQDLALWPHMTVRENVGFGLKSKNLSRRQREEMVDRILNRVNIRDRGDCYPDELSGGERQRAALGRTIVLEPKVILMDEPLASLDPLLKAELGQVIKTLQEEREITILYVTHDQIEAMLMGNHIAVMNQGRIEQKGTTQELLANPKNEFVKRFLMTSKMANGPETHD
jgi:iron(III) transport system ATP-binding protein